jgi:hypothetical protein
MSTRIPPDNPEDVDQEARQAARDRVWIYRQAFLKGLEEAMAHDEPEAILKRFASPPPTQSGLSWWATTLLQGVTLVAIVSCAFWLGSLSTTVSNTSQKLDKLSDGVVGVSRDSLSNRMIAIETKLNDIDNRLATIQQPQKK